MSISIKDFWKLAYDGKLLTVDQAKQLHGSFMRQPGAAQAASAPTLAEWLVASGVLSRYQTQLLLAGQPGPFVFGEYRVREPASNARLHGLFHANHIPTGHGVLLQFLSGDATQNPRAWAGVTGEAEAAASAKHPHLSRMYELVDAGDYKFAVLEELGGATIAERLAGRATVPGEACRIVRDAALGLARLHELGHSHGEVRPANLWVEDCGTVKLLQFPLARDPLARRAVTEESVDYVAPELLSSGRHADPLADIYSLGCTLYELIAGRVPFVGGDMNQKVMRHMAENPDPVEHLAAMPPAVAQIVGYLMAKDPQSRYQAAAHVAEALGPFVTPINSQPTVAPATLAAYEQVLAKPKAAPRAAAAAPTAPAQAPVKPAAAASSAARQAAASQPAASQPAARQPGANGGDAGKQTNPRQPAAGAAPGAAASAAGRVSARPVPISKVAPEPIAMKPLAEAPLSESPLAPLGGDGGGFAPIVPIEPQAGPVKTKAAGALPPIAPLSQLQPAPVAPVAPAPRGPKPKKNLATDNLVIGGVVGVAILILVGFLFYKSSSDQEEIAAIAQPEQAAPIVEPEQPAEPPASSNGTETGNGSARPAKPENPDDNGEVDPTELAAATPAPVKPAVKPGPPPKPVPVEVDDDGETLWVSPTNGGPLDLSFLPAGGQVFFALRPKEINANPEGGKIAAGFGPAIADVKTQIQNDTGMSFDNDPIEQLIIAFVPDESGILHAAYVVRLSEPIEEAALVTRWKDPAPQGDLKKYYQNDTWAYYIPASGANKVFAVMPAKEGKDVVASDEPPPLRKEMEKMLRDTDASRHFTLLANPSYVFTDGASLFSGNLEKLQKPLANFLGDNVQAAMLSCHLGENFFVEMRAYGSLDQDAFRLAKNYREKLAQIPGQIKEYFFSLNPHPYGKRVIYEFPQMISTMENFTRTGEENKQAVLRCYLPGTAGHNLVMGAELSLAETPGAATVASAAGPAAPKAISTPAEALKQKISLSFPRDTLEKTMVMLGEEIKWEVVILGGDLQLEGITKNQSFGLDERDKPADEILRKIMMLANPDGKLVYIFKPKNPGEKDIIYITTRASAAKRGDKLPPELEQAPAKK